MIKNKLIHKEGFWVLVVMAITLLAYLKILHFDFVYWDDDKQLFNNYYVTLFSFNHIKHNLFLERFTFIPLTLYSIVYQLFGKNILIYHLLSLCFHLFNVYLFYIVIRKFNFSSLVTVFSVLLFALHPLRIESVAWISEWKDLLFTCFSLLAILVYFNWSKQPKKRFIVIYVMLAWAAGFSKVQGLLLPFSIILLDTALNKKINWKLILFQVAIFAFVLFSIKIKTYYFILALLCLWFIYHRFFSSKIKIKATYLKKWAPLVLILALIVAGFLTRKIWFWSGEGNASITDRFVYASYALTFYLKQFIFPWTQVAIHSYPSVFGIALWKQWGLYTGIWLLMGLGLWLLIKSNWKNKWIVFTSLLFFLLNISIVLHIVPIEGRLIVAERYTYFAYSGLIIALAFMVEHIIQGIAFYIKPLLLCMIGIICFVLTYIRVDVWKNTETLFGDVIAKKPATSFAWTNLGSYFLEKKNYTLSEKYYRQAIKLNPVDVQNYLNMALVQVALNRNEEAIGTLSEGLEKATLNDDKSMFLVTQGQIYAQQGNSKKAMQLYNQSLHLYNKNYKACLQKSLLYANDVLFRNIDSAIFYAQKAIVLNKYYADAYHTLGWLYLLKGNIPQSKTYIQKAIDLNPFMALAYNSRGYLSYIQGDYETALSDYTHALQLDSTLLDIRKNRAWSYFQSKQYELAVKDYQLILQQSPRDIIAIINSAFANTYLSNYAQAIRQFKQAAYYFPDSAVYVQNLGWCFMQAKQYDSAIYYFNRALLSNPSLMNSLYNRGYLYLLKNEPEKALHDFTSLQHYYPQMAESYFWIGESYRLLGNQSKACSLYQQALSMGFSNAQQAIQKYCKNDMK